MINFIKKLLRIKPIQSEPKEVEVKYYFNKTIYCSKCDKLRYYGYTSFYDEAMCCCKHPENIPSYEDAEKFKSYLDENYKHFVGFKS